MVDYAHFRYRHLGQVLQNEERGLGYKKFLEHRLMDADIVCTVIWKSRPKALDAQGNQKDHAAIYDEEHDEKKKYMGAQS